MGDFERQKQALLKMRERLIRTVGSLEESIREDVTAPGDISTLPTHLADHDAEGIDRDIVLAETQEGLLEQVEAALERMEHGTYGRCQGCGKPIAPDRLAALPYTSYCIECAGRNPSSRPPGSAT